ncbi:putative transcription factor C2H2 family [Helianthus annuus]|uniref:Putative RING/U-box superfamily protein n=1 Tax=Helianthus annuus TaxID=4232 RepID=A0A251SID2_HELAN|nr:uncharacterized protein LOC110908325 [Helianthus annuus]KAF5767821.1 putative transcription factor C2H2 family [Helianthus annuus]KAJ0463273.1 putative transcription factor C2H2 family [Helianthus annuus]KAJ0467186.1 putative transcription factor C2H2 family [Helianthus annuus]KAJ0484649.1 putative transcription factor C2H2 family [Helianthus annuus]KAJ0655203.1 putative transcription factor C2H2 family [Helianthus annuus]
MVATSLLCPSVCLTGISSLPILFILIVFFNLTHQPCSFIAMDGQQQQLVNAFPDLSIHDQGEQLSSAADENHHGFCAICLNKIALQETALVKGCEHAYCVICILRWATYKKEPTCPQCKHPFEFLTIHRSLDGSIHDYMFEESVCLLLRASWFHPLRVESHEVLDNHVVEDVYPYAYEEAYDDEDEDLDEVYLGRSSNINIRIGNRRWGNNGFVRAGKQEARPVHHQSHSQDSGAGSSSREPKKKDAAAKDAAAVGRRAKRALKREAADKAAAAKHQQHLVRLGRG